MARSPNYNKWKRIFHDYKKGMKWDELVKKHTTSKRTISKAINFYNNLEISDKIQEKIHDKAKQITRTIESLNNITRLRLVMLLGLYNDIGLGDLSKKLDLSKSTVLRHLKELEKIGVIDIRREKVKGSRLKQYYSVPPNILKMMKLSHSLLRNIPPEEALDALIIDLQADASFFSIFMKILDEVILYNKDLQKDLKEYRPTNYQTIEKIFSTESHYRYFFWYLNKAQYSKFRLRYQEFMKNLKKDFKLIEKEENNNIDKENLYFVFHSLIPLKKIYDRKFID